MAAVHLLFALVASCLLATASAADDVSLESLCSSNKVVLTSMQQVKGLIQEAKISNLDTCAKFKDSLVDLEEVLSLVQAGQTSSLDFTSKLAKYHDKYIASETNQVRDGIPQALRQFFNSMCFQISADFKIQLVNNLEVDSKKYITSEDYESVQLLDKFGASLIDSEAQIDDFDDIILVSSLNKAAGFEEENEIKLMIKVKTSQVMRNLVKTCRNKFAPIYEKLILPLISLSNMGYNYQGEMLKVELSELKSNPLVRRWYVIVQACETFKAVEIFEASDMIVDGDRQAFTFIAPEEARELREKQLSTEQEAARVQPIEYHPEAYHRDDLWIADQQELGKLLKAYKASSTEAGRTRSLLLKKLLGRLRSSLKSGKILLYASEMVKGGLSGDKSVTNVNEDLIGMMDEAVEESEDTLTINKSDEAVSGWRGKGKDKRRPVIPERAGRIAKKVDGSKMSSKIYKWSIKSIAPKRSTIAWWIAGIAIILLIGVLVVAMIG